MRVTTLTSRKKLGHAWEGPQAQNQFGLRRVQVSNKHQTRFLLDLVYLAKRLEKDKLRLRTNSSARMQQQ